MMNKCKWFVFKDNLVQSILFTIILCCLAVSGCSTSLYSVNMNYNAAKANIPAYLKADDKGRNATIMITSFIDSRKGDEPLVIGRVVEKDGMKRLILPKYAEPTRAVTLGVKTYLSKAGYKAVINPVPWNLREESIPKGENEMIIGGSIDELDLTCRRGFPTDSYKARIKLSIVLADGGKRKILYQGSVESDSSLEHVSFSEERLEEQVNVVLRDAIEKMFEDKKIAQKIKQIP